MEVSDYTDINSDYTNLHSDYTNINHDYNNRNSDYTTLDGDYNILDSDYTILDRDYTLLDNLTFSNNSEISDRDYLIKILGPQRLKISLLIPMSLVYGFIFLTGVAGNVAVCVVIIRQRSPLVP